MTFFCARNIRVREVKHLRFARATRTRAIFTRTRNIVLALRARNARSRIARAGRACAWSPLCGKNKSSINNSTWFRSPIVFRKKLPSRILRQLNFSALIVAVTHRFPPLALLSFLVTRSRTLASNLLSVRSLNNSSISSLFHDSICPLFDKFPQVFRHTKTK